MNTQSLGLLAAAGTLVFASHAAAQPTFEGDPVVVTATRSAQRADASLAAVSVITRADIERAQAPDLLELLRLEAGVDVARSGGPGGQTSVFLRGTNSNHVLVLIDGVRVSAAGSGAFTWEIVDPAIVERIEIVRGPRAARWGSDAIGGVIQIFTRLPDGSGARAAYGRYDDRQLSAHWGNGFLGLNASARSVEGFSAQNPSGFGYDPDDDGFDNLSVSARGDYRALGGRLGWSARLASGDVEFDQGESEFLNYALHGRYRRDTAGPWTWEGTAAFYRDDLETDSGFSLSEAATRRLQAGIQAERGLGADTTWLLGVDAWRVEGDTRGAFDEDRNNFGVWTGLDGRRAAWSWEASLRADRDGQFGTAVTGNLAGGWRFAEGWRLSASLGRAFRAPSFSQLYSPGFGGQYAGNPELDPETSISGELGLDWTGPAGHAIGLSVYRNEVDDLIAFSGPEFQAVNVEQARIHGAELRHRFTTRRWRASSNLTWQDAENRSTGTPLLRRAEFKASFSLDRTFDNGGWLGAELVHVGERPDFGTELPSYSLVNLRAGWPLGAGLSVEGRLENLTDEDYEPVAGYNASRRAAFVALRWRSPRR
jgi:vitamin B12 transporter